MIKSKHEFGGRHFTADVILWAVRKRVARKGAGR